MTRIIPNENSWIGWAEDVLLETVTEDEIETAVDLTPFCVSITASAQGNAVPTPTLDSLFETSVPGTSQASFTADFYRDDVEDTAWDALPRGAKGTFIISRFGATGQTAEQKPKPIATDVVELWPIQVTSRGAGPLSSNTVQTFTCTGAVPIEPEENITVAPGIP